MLNTHALSLTLTHQHRQDGHLTNAIYFLFHLRTKNNYKCLKISHTYRNVGERGIKNGCFAFFSCSEAKKKFTNLK